MFKTVRYQEEPVKLQIWDTAGQERYKTITRAYYRGAHCILLMFDIHVRVSFDRLHGWVSEIQNHANQNVALVLVGNKLDLASERQVTEHEAEKFASSLHCAYIEVSAKTGEHINDLFEHLALEQTMDRLPLIQQSSAISLGGPPPPCSGGICGNDSC